MSAQNAASSTSPSGVNGVAETAKTPRQSVRLPGIVPLPYGAARSDAAILH
jgi:hypothetical protein